MGGTLTERIKNGRVDFVGIGDSNQLLSGHGWDHGMQYALYTKYPMYATELMSVFENNNSGVGRGYNYARLSALYAASASTPQELLDWSTFNLNFCGVGYYPIGHPSIYGGLSVDAACGIGVNEQLVFDVHHIACGAGSPGQFKIYARLGVSPYTALGNSDFISSGFGALGAMASKSSFTIAPGSGRTKIEVLIGGGVGPYCISWCRLQNPARKTGVSYHTLTYLGGHSLYTQATKFDATTDKALTHFFDIIRKDQGSTKTVVICINSGLNDRAELNPSKINGFTPGDSAPAFVDNLEYIVARIRHIWEINGWDERELFWVFSVSHPVSDPDDAELASYRVALESYAADKLRCQVVDFLDLTSSTEMAANDWYLTAGDKSHLKQAGYESLSTRIVDALEITSGNDLMWGAPAALTAPLPLSAQPCKDHALPIGVGKITIFDGIASASQIEEAK